MSDPRTAAELGAKTEKRIKGSINSAINGSGNKVFEWIKTNYPATFGLWNQTELSRTGTQISKSYETRLILDPGVFELSEELGIDILPEHDGLGVFAIEGDPEIDEKTQKLVTQIQDNCLKILE